MICERSVVIFTCAVLSNLTTHSNSWATELRASNSTSLFPQPIVQQQDEKNVAPRLPATLVLGSNEPLASDNNQEEKPETEVISKHWSLVGMGLTSAFFLFVLWILFQPESKKGKATEVNDISLIESAQSSNEADNNIEVLQDQELIPPEPLPMIGMEYIESDLATHLDKINPIPTNETTTGEPLPRQPLPQVEELALTLQPKQLRMQTEITNQVTIVTAKTTEIDVVFELIQDLQQSDRLLRRKAIWKLAQTGDFRVIEPLLSVMSEADSLDKSLILDAITKIAQRGLQPVNQALFISLETENSEVKKNAIQDATVIYQSIFPITKRLYQMLEDSDIEVQQTARWALQQFQQQLSWAIAPENSVNNGHDKQTLIGDPSQSNTLDVN